MGGKTKLALWGVIVLVAAFALAACGGSDESATVEAQGTTAEEKEAPADSTTAESEGSQGREGEGEQTEKSAEEESSQNGQGKRGSEQGSAVSATPGEVKAIRSFGSQAGSAEAEVATGTLRAYIESIENEDWKASCEALSRELFDTLQRVASSSKQVKGKGCSAAFATAAQQSGFSLELGSLSSGSIDQLRVKGKNGFALYDAESLAMPMVKEGADWQVGALEARPLS